MIYSLDLDITPNGVPQIVKLSQYDKTMPTLAITLYNGSQVFTIPTGCTAYIEGTKADKTGFQYPCTVSGGVINATITEQMTVFAGRVPCEIVLRKSGERKGSANFFLDIEPSALSDDTVISDSDLPIIQQMPEYAQSCADDAELAHKWATFGSDSETPSATNNAKYWAEQAEAVTGVGDLMTTRSKLGAKNLIPLSIKTTTRNGVTITVQDDGSIVLNGTVTGDADIYIGLTKNGIPLESGKCIMNGSSGGGESSYLLFAATSGGTTLYSGEIGGQRIRIQSQNGDSPIFDINKMSTSTGSSYVDPSEVNIYLWIAKGYTCNNVVIKPMIRLATDHDSTYQPYAMTNKELTDAVADIPDIKDATRTNLLNPTAQTQTKNGVTLTNNGDGTYTVNGTPDSGYVLLTLMQFTDFTLLENKKLVGCPAGGTSSTYDLYISCNKGSTWIKGYDDYGKGVIISNIPSEATDVKLHILVRNGYTANNLLFKPMLTTDLNATYDDYVRYTGNSGRLNENVAEIYTDLSVTDITSQVTVHENLTADYFYVRQSGKVVMVLGTFTVTGDIPNGQTLLSGLPNTGINPSAAPPIMVPVRASMWSATPSKYHFQGLSGNRITNATITLKSGDVIQISYTYITTS